MASGSRSEEVPHNALPTKPYFSQNRRVPQYQSVYSPNQELGVSSIGGAMRVFKIVEKAAMDILKQVKNGDDELKARIAKHYEMPADLVQIAAEQLDTSESASVALSCADYAIGTLGLSYDPEVEHFRIVHTQFDSLAYLIDINAFQDTYAIESGLKKGWRLTRFGNDFHRMVRNFFKFRLGVKRADAPVDFIDFGSLESLKAKGVQFTDDEAYQYEVEYINHRYLAISLVAFLEEKKADLQVGDLLEKDMPQWSVRVNNFFSDSVVINVKDQTLDIDGAASKFVWKMLPWSLLFKIGEVDAKTKDFIHSVCRRVEQQVVHQPLWTHVVSHPCFADELSQWVTENADKVHIEGIEKPADYVLPVGHSYVLKTIDGGINPQVAGEDFVCPHRPTESISGVSIERTKYSRQIIHALMVSGKRSAGMYLEARSNTYANGDAPVEAAIHPAPMCYMPWALERKEAEEAKAKKKAEEEQEDKKKGE